MLFDSPEDVYFGKVSVFGNISPLFWCKNWGVNHRAEEGANDKPLKMSQIISFFYRIFTNSLQWNGKAGKYLMHYIKLPHRSKFRTNFTLFGVQLLLKNHPEAA